MWGSVLQLGQGGRGGANGRDREEKEMARDD